MSRTTRKADARRDEILKGAAACFNEKGVRGAGVADICERLGISPGHLYYYFKSKEAILLALLDLQRGQVLEEHRRIAERPDGLDFLLSADFFERNRRVPVGHLDIPVLWELYGEAERAPGPIADWLQQHWVDGQEMVRAVLERARANGRLRPETDVEILLVHLNMFLVTTQLASRVEPGFDLARYQRTIRATLAPVLVEAG
jgi:AcrR family transcriptional regulator